MGEVTGSKSWTEELASLVEDTGIRFTGSGAIGVSSPTVFMEGEPLSSSSSSSEVQIGPAAEAAEEESLKDQVKGFVKAWGELAVEFGRGVRDVVQQTVLTEDSYIVRKTKGPVSVVSAKLSFLNDYLPEDRDPVIAWPVIFSVFFLAFAVLSVHNRYHNPVPPAKKVYIHPPSALRILLPNGRYMAYQERGVPAEKARFTIIAPHSFLSSRLAGIPGINVDLLEEFGVRLLSYDLPGFGESDPHPGRDLNTSALDISHLADSTGVTGKFWLLGHSTGAMHAWAALRYIPSRIAGVAMFGPMVNPYESTMTKEEMSRSWEKWTRRRKSMYFLARRFSKSLNYFYRRTFLSGRHGPIEKWLSVSLGDKDKAAVDKPAFEEFWHRNVEESIRQGTVKPFIEEAVLQVSNWGFTLKDLQVQKKCPGKGFFPWLRFMYGQAECELTGFLGPIHIWQGLDDQVVHPAMTEYVARVLPSVNLHNLPEDGHFSYLFFCDECHRQIFSTLFGTPQGPLEVTDETSTGSDGDENSIGTASDMD